MERRRRRRRRCRAWESVWERREGGERGSVWEGYGTGVLRGVHTRWCQRCCRILLLEEGGALGVVAPPSRRSRPRSSRAGVIDRARGSAATGVTVGGWRSLGHRRGLNNKREANFLFAGFFTDCGCCVPWSSGPGCGVAGSLLPSIHPPVRLLVSVFFFYDCLLLSNCLSVPWFLPLTLVCYCLTASLSSTLSVPFLSFCTLFQTLANCLPIYPSIYLYLPYRDHSQYGPYLLCYLVFDAQGHTYPSRC